MKIHIEALFFGVEETNVFLPARPVSAEIYFDIGGDLMLIETSEIGARATSIGDDAGARDTVNKIPAISVPLWIARFRFRGICCFKLIKLNLTGFYDQRTYICRLR